MIIKNVNLDYVCGITSALPKTGKTEIAFAGKSNVGKSSLINALMNRKSYARTSAQPGKTQTINYYNINDDFYLVDLPGYGFAKAGKETVADWGKMIEDYLYQSETLKQVFLLIDIRHEPSDNDVLMYNWIKKRGYEPIIIATKADKINRSQLNKQLSMIRKTLGVPSDAKIFPFSALSKQGRDEIVGYMDEILDSGLE